MLRGFLPRMPGSIKKSCKGSLRVTPRRVPSSIIHHFEGHQILGGSEKSLPFGENQQIFGTSLGKMYEIPGDHGGMYPGEHHLPGMRNIHGNLQLRKSVIVEQLSRGHGELCQGVRSPGGLGAPQEKNPQEEQGTESASLHDEDSPLNGIVDV
jgi:hypothetical protein